MKLIDPIQLTQELISIPSESSNPIDTPVPNPEQLIVEHLASICREYSITHNTHEALPGRHNFIASFPSSSPKKVLIMAHMDTVSADKMDQPFAGKIKDNKIWGRGACDDKGPLATAFSVLINLSAQKKDLPYNVTFAATVDEECSMSGAKALARLEEGSWDLIVGLEPTGLQIIKAHKGVYRCQISTTGLAAHSSSPSSGQNAIMAMTEIITDLQMLEDRLKRERHKELGRASLAITQIAGGSSINIIPDHCQISVDVRLLPDQEPSLLAKTIKSLVGWRGEVVEIFAAHGIYSDIDDENVKLFTMALAANYLPTEATTAAYATDCSQLNENGPCIVWGPGHIDQAHQIDEHIELKQIHKAYEVLYSFFTTPAQ